MNRASVASDRGFAYRNRLGVWMGDLLRRLQSARRREEQRKVKARFAGKNITTRSGRNSHRPAVFWVIALTLLGSILGYLILVFHQD